MLHAKLKCCPFTGFINLSKDMLTTYLKETDETDDKHKQVIAYGYQIY